MMTEEEVRKVEGKLPNCGLCGSEEDEGYERCFHCSNCGYLQCCDYDGFYAKVSARCRNGIGEGC